MPTLFAVFNHLICNDMMILGLLLEHVIFLVADFFLKHVIRYKSVGCSFAQVRGLSCLFFTIHGLITRAGSSNHSTALVRGISCLLVAGDGLSFCLCILNYLI